MKKIEQHNHDGINSERLDPRHFRGFPTTTDVPTHPAEIGTLIFNTSNNRLYIRTASAWRYITTS
jgi:hypothetical protein